MRLTLFLVLYSSLCALSSEEAKPIAEFALDERITSLGPSADGRWLVLGTDRGTVHFWDLEKSRSIRSIRIAKYEQVTYVGFVSDTNFVAVQVAGEVIILDAATGKVKARHPLGKRSWTAWSEQSRYVAYYGEETKEVCLWDCVARKEMTRWPTAEGYSLMSVSDSGRLLLATMAKNRKYRYDVFDPKANQGIKVPGRPQGVVGTTQSFSRVHKYEYGDSSVTFRTSDSGQICSNLSLGIGWKVTGPGIFSPDQQTFAVGCEFRDIKEDKKKTYHVVLVDVPSGQLCGKLSAPRLAGGLKFSRDGRRLFGSSRFKQVFVWSIDLPPKGGRKLKTAGSILEAVFNKRTLLAKRLLEEGADANATDGAKNPALYYAIRNGDLEMVKMLVQHKARLTDRTAVSSHSVLHMALTSIRDDKRREAILEYLLEQGADPNARDKNDYTPLHYVRSTNDVDLLMKCKADINAVNKQGQSPLLMAAGRSTAGALAALLKHDPDLKAADLNGTTALHGVFRFWRTDGEKKLRCLLEAKLPVNARDREGRTPLHAAIKSRCLAGAKMLLDNGADPTIKDREGVSPDTMLGRPLKVLFEEAERAAKAREPKEKPHFGVRLPDAAKLKCIAQCSVKLKPGHIHRDQEGQSALRFVADNRQRTIIIDLLGPDTTQQIDCYRIWLRDSKLGHSEHSAAYRSLAAGLMRSFTTEKDRDTLMWIADVFEKPPETEAKGLPKELTDILSAYMGKQGGVKSLQLETCVLQFINFSDSFSIQVNAMPLDYRPDKPFRKPSGARPEPPNAPTPKKTATSTER